MHFHKNKKYRRHRLPKSLNAYETADIIARTARGESMKSVAARYSMCITSVMRVRLRFTETNRGAEAQLTLF